MKALLAVTKTQDREMISACLEEYHVQTLCVAAADDLGACYRQEQPQLVIIDLDWFPDDEATLEQLRHLRPSKGFLYVLLLAAASQQQRAAQHLRYAHDLLYRPCIDALVKAKLRQVVLLYKAHENMAHNKKLVEDTIYELDLYQSAGKMINSVMEPCRQYYPNIKHLFLPASSLSGDLLLVEHQPGGSQFILLGDITGHGFTAFMATLPLTQFYSKLARNSKHLEGLVHELNLLMYRHLPTGLFAAVAIVELDPRQKRLQLWNGGLPDALIWRTGQQRLERLPSANCALGIQPNVGQEFYETYLDTDDCIYLYTDGLIEAHNVQGQQFGRARLEDCLKDCDHVYDRFDRVCLELDRFTEGANAHDDVTFIEIAPHAPR